jgi:hypothetical protein
MSAKGEIMSALKNSARRCLALLFVLATLAACSSNQPTTFTGEQPRFGTTKLRLPGYEEAVKVSYEIIDGQAVYQGDIGLGEVDEEGNLINRQTEGELTSQGAGTIAGNGHFDVRWPNGVVPYVIEGINSTPVLQAMAHWEAKTDIRFVPRTTESDYVAFVRANGNICISHGLGRWGGRQTVASSSLYGACSANDYIHEIGHVMGLFHEHVRFDRDKYVTIRWDKGAANYYNFCKIGEYYDFSADKCVFDINEPQGADIGPYDYRSIMHYNNSFIESIPPGKPMGNTELSSGDVSTINIMYPFYTGKAATSLNSSSTKKRLVADVTGDGRDDLLTFIHDTQTGEARGDVLVGVRAPQNNLDAFLPYFYSDQKWESDFCMNATEVCATGDFNGDGKDDIVTFHNGAFNGSGQVFAALSNGSSFVSDRVWESAFCKFDTEVCATGDFNGDGKDDIIAFHNGAYSGSRQVFVATSNGSSFVNDKLWHNDFCADGETCAVADVNGDGKDDIISFLRGPDALGANGDVYVALSNGTSFGAKDKWHKNICYKNHVCTLADINGDGRDDLVTFTQEDASWPEYGTSGVMVALSYGYAFGRSLELHENFCAGQAVCATGDTNGDGKDDLVTFGPSLDMLGRNVLVAESRLRTMY